MFANEHGNISPRYVSLSALFLYCNLIALCGSSSWQVKFSQFCCMNIFGITFDYNSGKHALLALILSLQIQYASIRRYERGFPTVTDALNTIFHITSQGIYDISNMLTILARISNNNEFLLVFQRSNNHLFFS